MSLLVRKRLGHVGLPGTAEEVEGLAENIFDSPQNERTEVRMSTLFEAAKLPTPTLPLIPRY